MMIFKQEVETQIDHTNKKHPYKANKRAILAKVKQCFVEIVFDVGQGFEEMIQNIIKCLLQEVVPIRNNRKFKRANTYKAKRKWANNYVPVV